MNHDLYKAVQELQSGNIEQFQTIIRSELYRRAYQEVEARRVAVGAGLMEDSGTEIYMRAMHTPRRMRELEGDNISMDDRPMHRAPRKRADTRFPGDATESSDDDPAPAVHTEAIRFGRRAPASKNQNYRYTHSGKSGHGILHSIFKAFSKPKKPEKPVKQPKPPKVPKSEAEKLADGKAAVDRKMKLDAYRKEKKAEAEKAKKDSAPRYGSSKPYDPIGVSRRARERKKAAWKARNPHTPDPTDTHYSPPKPSFPTKTWDKHSPANVEKMKHLADKKHAEDAEVKRRGRSMSDAEYNKWHKERYNEAVALVTEGMKNDAYKHNFKDLANMAYQHTGRLHDPKAIESELRTKGTVNIAGKMVVHNSATSRAKYDASKFVLDQGPEIKSAKLDPIRKSFTVKYRDGGEPLLFTWQDTDSTRAEYLKAFAQEVSVRLKSISGTKSISESLTPNARKVYAELMHDISANTMGANEIAAKVKSKIGALSKQDQDAIREEILGDV